MHVYAEQFSAKWNAGWLLLNKTVKVLTEVEGKKLKVWIFGIALLRCVMTRDQTAALYSIGIDSHD